MTRIIALATALAAATVKPPNLDAVEVIREALRGEAVDLEDVGARFASTGNRQQVVVDFKTPITDRSYSRLATVICRALTGDKATLVSEKQGVILYGAKGPGQFCEVEFYSDDGTTLTVSLAKVASKPGKPQ